MTKVFDIAVFAGARSHRHHRKLLQVSLGLGLHTDFEEQSTVDGHSN